MRRRSPKPRSFTVRSWLGSWIPPIAARLKRFTGVIWRGFATTWSAKLGRYGPREIDFAVYIWNNVLSHIFVTLNTEFHVSRYPHRLPTPRLAALARARIVQDGQRI